MVLTLTSLLPLSFSTLPPVGDPLYFANIEYLGQGYDMARGNPHPGTGGIALDPGFTLSVFNMNEYTQNQITADQKYYVPDGSQVEPSLSCEYQATTSEIYGAQSLQTALSVDASVKTGSALPWSFSASSSYKSVSDSSSTHRTSYASSVATCISYTGQLIPGAAALRSDFISRVAALPNTLSDTSATGPYGALVAAYGTHYTEKVYMGSKAVYRSSFTSSSWNTLTSSSLTVQTAASASFFKATGAAEYDESAAQSFESNRSSVTEIYLGSKPPTNGDWTTWANESEDSPFPMRYVLVMLSDALTSTYFPNDPSIAQKSSALTEYIEKYYCPNVPGCVTPGPDYPPMNLNVQQTSVITTGNAQCAIGEVAISCGMWNTKYDAIWGAQTSGTNPNSCECKNNAGAECFALCANQKAIGTVQTVMDGEGANYITCPSGYKVTSCGLYHWDESTPTTSIFPENDTTCRCDDGGTGENLPACIATCATDIAQYQIRTNAGTGWVSVTCPDETIALGCGYEEVNNGMAEKYVKYGPTTGSELNALYDFKTCSCFNDGDVTCYAICGIPTAVTGS